MGSGARRQAMDAAVSIDAEDAPGGVTIVITTYNHAHFLRDALESAAYQSVAAEAVLVVDDGSTDDPVSILREFPDVRLIRTANRGLAAARNEGLAQAKSRFVLFLDADDVLEPDAVAAGLACMDANPGAGLVYGAHQRVDRDLRPIDPPNLSRAGPRAYESLLRQNVIQMHAAVLYDREKLAGLDGFDPIMPCCEDFDIYLRMSQRYRIASHPALVARYRIHDGNMSHRLAEMLRWHMYAYDKCRPSEAAAETDKARWREGRLAARRSYLMRGWLAPQRAHSFVGEAGMARGTYLENLEALAKALIWRLAPAGLKTWLRETVRARRRNKRGDVDFGDFARIQPMDSYFGFGRGTPIDRFYIERFLAEHAADITGRVLEFGDSRYAAQYGGNVSVCDVLALAQGRDEATIIGDIVDPSLLPEAAYDCIIAVQSLQYVYDLSRAVENLHRALRPGGVLLLTAPAISPMIDEGEEGRWLWAFSATSLNRLLKSSFGDAEIELQARGNAFAATCFVQGLAMEDISPTWLEPGDPTRPILITARASRAE